MTRFVTLTTCCVLLLAFKTYGDEPPYGNIRLLEGYKYKPSRTFDTINATIYKPGGLSIEFEEGISEGYAVKREERNKYIWYREQVISGHKVLLALAQSGTGTSWEPEKPRGPKPRKILMVSIPGRFGPNHVANFYAEVLDETEIADMLLMVLTFDPSK